MNKIFKVVWSKVKHCYVVVSEIAKNTTSGGARRSRVRKEMKEFDIHNRVNYAAIKSRVIVNKEEKTLKLNLVIDTTICSIMEYFEIFLSRMKLCEKAASFFGLTFKLVINDQELI